MVCMRDHPSAVKGPKTMTTKVQMVPKGRFGMLMAEAVQRQGFSLRTLAVKLDYSYEQLRKLWQGGSSPSESLVVELCKVLKIDLDEARKAVTGDQMERRYGPDAFTVMGRDPRITDIEPLLAHLSKDQWDMVLTQIRALAQQKLRGGVL